MKLLEFERTTNAFNFVFEYDLSAEETVIVKLPPVSANKRGINDIGWLSDADADENGVPKITLYGTLAKNPKSEKALWQEIRVNDEINKCTSAIKIENKGNACRIEMRAIFN
jgi:hypothetical protein